MPVLPNIFRGKRTAPAPIGAAMSRCHRVIDQAKHSSVIALRLDSAFRAG
jgi:hypothetical protein